MKKSVLFLTFPLIILMGISLPQQMKAVAQNPSQKTLKVLSWNIYMLPPLAKITGKRQRAEKIAELLKNSDYDVLVLQEAFHPAARRLIKTGLGDAFPYQIGPANRKFSVKTNSGIWILSRHPLTELGSVDYEECEGFDDCFARKGALMVELQFRGRPVQILGTHLQAGGPHHIRHSQYQEMRQLLDKHSRQGVPQLVCGDMNTRRSDVENYSIMMETLDAEDGPFEGERQFTADGAWNDLCGGGSRNRRVIDYIFVRDKSDLLQPVRRWIPVIRKQWSVVHDDLSDHNPVAIEIDWKE